MHAEPPDDPAALPWIVTATVEARLALPEGVSLDRDDFHDWLWERAAGLVGIDEGCVTAADAAASGLAPPGLVLDTAAAPADRDWVARLAVAAEEWWFADESSARAAVDLVAAVRGCTVRDLRADVPADRVAESRAAFEPIAVPGFGIVRPAWEDGVAGVAADGGATIFIDPGLGFGTGLHETTQLCLAALTARRREGRSLATVLDYGSGSGILGIAAAVLGATRVEAVEIDDRVHPAIESNARRNGVAGRIHVAASLPDEPPTCDVVIANIVAPVLLADAAALCARVRPRGGGLVLSGLLAADLPAVADRYAALLGSRPIAEARGEWRCLSFTRP